MKRTNFAIVSTVALLMVGGYFALLTLTPVEGQEQPPPEVFTPVDAADWVDPQLPDDAILRSRPVTINMNTLALVTPPNPNAAVPAVPVRFNLFDDLSVTVVFHKARPRYDIQIPENPMDLLGQEFEPVGYTWSGDIVGEQQGYAVLVTKGEVCMANVYVAGEGWFKLGSSDAGHVIREISGGGPRQCGVQAESSAGGGSAEGSGSGCGIDGATCEDGSVIDVMVLYTPAAEAETRDIEMEIDMAVEDTNAAYRNSEIDTTLRLIYKAEIDYTEAALGNLILNDLNDPWDVELDEVNPLRNALRADLVSLFVKQSISTSFASVMSEESPIFERRAFTVVRWIGASNDFPHELGHNMGCFHDRVTAGCVGDCECSGVCDFSFGHKFDILGKDYITTMTKVSGQKIPHFSNPDVEFCVGFFPPVCAPTGVAAPSCDSADNAQTINTTRDTVANFRETCDTTDTTTMVSFGFFSGQGDAASREISMSNNGLYLAFTSEAANFGSPSGSQSEVFAYNRESGVVELASIHVEPAGHGDSFEPAVSGDGHFVVFASDAQNLKLMLGQPPDTNGLTDIYAWHYGSGGQLRRLSLNSAEVQSTTGASFAPSISFNGRFVAFASTAEDLVGDDDNDFIDIFVRDRDNNEDLIFDQSADSETARISFGPLGVQANGDCAKPSISANDGRFVAFESLADNLLGACNPGVSGDCNGLRDIFVRDTDEAFPLTFRVNISTAGIEADAPSFVPSISVDGQFVAFESDATNLIGVCVPGVSGDCNGFRDIFVRDTAAPASTFRVSVASDGTEANGDSFAPVISADLRLVAFHSDATNLLGPGVDTNGQTDVFVYELETGDIFRPNISTTGAQATGGGSFAPAISKHGRYIAFESDATNLAPIDAGGFRDVFLREGGWCVGDLDGDGVVGDPDLAMLLGLWGPVTPCLPHVAYDFNQDCDIGPVDLAMLLANWGQCW